MPASWAGFSSGEWWRKVVFELAGRSFSSSEEYMEWLGQGREVFGEQGSNMVVVAAGILSRVVANE